MQKESKNIKTGIPEKQKGFTLIELSIVLVIIGLIVGGILVGQDLIRAAEIRATVAQIEKYNSAVNTFRTKYNGIPGDLSAANATAFGFVTRNGGSGRGDQNGLIDGTGGTNTNMVFTQESGMLWNDLSVANLIDGNFTVNAGNADSATVPAVAAASVSAVFPPARLARGNFVTAGSTGGLNYWLVGGISSTTVTTGAYAFTTNLTPIEVFNMDTKLDDGQPNTGVVQAKGTSASTATVFTDAATSAATTTLGKCILGDVPGTATSDTYNVNTASGGTTPACIIRFRFN
jgi:prepilin-type N-terminal cleavage/methylation domain-containing protein